MHIHLYLYLSVSAHTHMQLYTPHICVFSYIPLYVCLYVFICINKYTGFDACFHLHNNIYAYIPTSYNIYFCSGI